MVHVRNVRHSRAILERELVPLAPGLDSIEDIPGVSRGARTCTSPVTPRHSSRADGVPDSLVFRDVAAANRAVATLNDHPALQSLGIGFCAPRDAGTYPALDDELSKARQITGERYVGGRARTARAAWMDNVYDKRGNGTSCPSRVPTPDEIYDSCSAIGPVSKVHVQQGRLLRDSSAGWQAVVEFFEAADADEFQRSVNSSHKLFG